MLKIAGRRGKEEDNIESLAASENQYIMRQDDTVRIDGINSTLSTAFTDNDNDSKGLDGEPINSISKKVFRQETNYVALSSRMSFML